MPGQRLCRCLSLLLRPLCRSADQSRAKPAKLDGCRAILSRSRCCRLGGADPRSCRSGQTARVGRAAEGAPKGQAPLAGRSLGPHGTAVPGQRLCRCLSPAAASVPLCRSVQGEACEAPDGCRAILSRSRCCRLGGADPRSCRSGQTARVGRAAEGAPEGASPACGAQSRPARDGCAGSTALPVPLSSCGLLCRSADQSRAKPAKPQTGAADHPSVRPVHGWSSRRVPPGAQSRPARDGCAGQRPCCGRSISPGPQTGAGPSRGGRGRRRPRRGKPRLRGAVSACTGRVNGSAGPLFLLRPLCRSAAVRKGPDVPACRLGGRVGAQATDGCRRGRGNAALGPAPVYQPLPVPLSPAASVPLCRSVQGEACEAL